MNITADLLDRFALLFQGTYLSVEVVEIIAETLQVRSRAHIKVSWNHLFNRQIENLVKRKNPVFGAAIIHCRAGVIEGKIAHRDRMLLWKINEGIAGSVSLAGKINLYRISIKV